MKALRFENERLKLTEIGKPNQPNEAIVRVLKAQSDTNSSAWLKHQKPRRTKRCDESYIVGV